MKTATIDDLQHRLGMIFSWLEAGEDVVLRSRATSSFNSSATNKLVDWSQSAAFRNRTGERTLNAEETAELYESYRGEY
ncbi:MAG: hypothetical protein ACO1TE_21325 [Prosthecobacter sp.]